MSSNPPFSSSSPALEMTIDGQWGQARAGTLRLPHFTCQTPMFMPVGTQGTVKGLTVTQIEELGCPIILGNTYHLGHRPGGDLVEAMGGLHKFMNWKRNILTDSGGFQMVSLSKLSKVTEEGVCFQSPHDGSMMTLTPEHSIHLQNQIGADIIMALDDVVSSTTTGPRVEEAMNRTIRWLRRCVNAHRNPDRQNLFGIVQGGLDANLRERCLKEMTENFDLPGFAIGGLSGGESKDDFWKVVYQCTTTSPHHLPPHKPRYLMGVGYSVDLVVCVALGVDMFDCVYPSRTARFGTALVDAGGEGFGARKGGKLLSGQLFLRSNRYEKDYSPIDPTCECYVCKKYTRAYLHTVAGREGIGSQLLTYHNIAYLMRLMKRMRESILNGSFDKFVQDFMLSHFPDRDYPPWTVQSLKSVNINLL